MAISCSSSSDTTLAAKALVALQFQECSDLPSANSSLPEEVNSYPPPVTKIRKMTFKLEEKEYVVCSAQEKNQVQKAKKKKKGGRSLKKLIKRTGGSKPMLVIEKKLTITDGNEKQGRLLIPGRQVINDSFLTLSEKAQIGKKEDLPVLVFDPKGKKSKLNFGLCMMNKSTNYALKKKWNEVVKANDWKEDMVLQVWSFRVGLQLCFALVRVDDGIVPKA